MVVQILCWQRKEGFFGTTSGLFVKLCKNMFTMYVFITAVQFVSTFIVYSSASTCTYLFVKEKQLRVMYLPLTVLR